MLTWAARRGAQTSDEMLLALLQAGYDPDAANLGCCCCIGKATPRDVVTARGVQSHVDLFAHVAPGVVDEPQAAAAEAVPRMQAVVAVAVPRVQGGEGVDVQEDALAQVI